MIFLWPSQPTWDWALGPGPTVSSNPYVDLLLLDLTVANPKSSKMQDPRLPSLAQPGVQPHKGPHWLPPCEDPLRTRRVPSRTLASTETACCWAGRTAGAGGPQPPAQPAAPRLLASPKMTICHSIKVSGQLMGEPGSATPGQNGLLPGRGRSSNVKCRDIVPGPNSGPTPPMATRWTALG